MIGTKLYPGAYSGSQYSTMIRASLRIVSHKKIIWSRRTWLMEIVPQHAIANALQLQSVNPAIPTSQRAIMISDLKLIHSNRFQLGERDAMVFGVMEQELSETRRNKRGGRSVNLWMVKNWMPRRLAHVDLGRIDFPGSPNINLIFHRTTWISVIDEPRKNSEKLASSPIASPASIQHLILSYT